MSESITTTFPLHWADQIKQRFMEGCSAVLQSGIVFSVGLSCAGDEGQAQMVMAALREGFGVPVARFMHIKAGLKRQVTSLTRLCMAPHGANLMNDRVAGHTIPGYNRAAGHKWQGRKKQASLLCHAGVRDLSSACPRTALVSFFHVGRASVPCAASSGGGPATGVRLAGGQESAGGRSAPPGRA